MEQGDGDGKRPPIPSPLSTWAGQDGLGSHSGFCLCQPHADTATSPRPVPELRTRPHLLPTFLGTLEPTERTACRRFWGFTCLPKDPALAPPLQRWGNRARCSYLAQVKLKPGGLSGCVSTAFLPQVRPGAP